MVAQNQSGGIPAAPRRDFFPACVANGILLPGNESEVYLLDTGTALWHRRQDWAQGHQEWQTSAMPAEVVRESIKAIGDLIDADVQLRSMAFDALACLTQAGTPALQVLVPRASPYEPRKAITQDSVEITFPGGHVSDTGVILIRCTTSISQGQPMNECGISWRQPRDASNWHDADLPPDVMKDAVDVLERLVDSVLWLRANLNALTQP